VLTGEELERYRRQIDIICKKGQQRLKGAKAFVAGAGGLGSAILSYLTVAGIGSIKVVDNDTVEMSNLNRQILHWDSDIGRSKVLSVQEKMRRMNRNVQLEAIHTTINDHNVEKLVNDCDIIVDALDNFDTRYILNRAALAGKIPFFHGAVQGFYGQLTTIIPGRTPCLRCIFPVSPPRSAPPVIGVTPGVIGCLQAGEVIKYVTGVGKLLENRLLIWDGFRGVLDEVAVERNSQCRDCGDVA
jgi:molybdopterin/thiamine biosynthesis adenylyltransferase